jgi:hypothetical protein
MVQRLFLDGVDMPCDQFSVNKTLQDAALIFAHMADPALALRNHTAVAAEATPHFLIFEFLIKERFHSA